MDKKALFQERELLFVIWKCPILKVLGNFVAAVIVLFAASIPANAGIIFTGDFEHRPIPLTRDNSASPFYRNAYDVSVVTSPISPRAGTHYLRSYTQLSGAHFRSEVVPKGIPLFVGTEYWMGISIFIPSDWETDLLKYDTPILFQTHHNSWSGLPTMALPFNISLRQSPTTNWQVRLANGGPSSGDWDSIYYASYLADIGKWTDWVFNFKFSDTSAGFFKVWKDGVLVGEKTGRNYASGHEDYPANIQFGLYTWGYRESIKPNYFITTSQTIYHDEFRVGDANSSFHEVSPAGGPVLDVPSNLRIIIPQSQ